MLEIGTPLVLKEGRRGIEKMRAAFPCHEILADYKIMDAGDLEAAVAFQAGASIVTVLAAANPATIRAAIDQAQRDGGKVMIDMIEAKNFADSVVQMDAFGAAYVQVHTAFDGRGDKSPLDELVTAKRLLKNAQCAVAGGIGRDNIAEIARQRPDLVVVGSKVCLARNRRTELEYILKQAEG